MKCVLVVSGRRSRMAKVDRKALSQMGKVQQATYRKRAVTTDDGSSDE